MVWITRKICHGSRSCCCLFFLEHHAGGFLAAGGLELGVKFGLAWVLSHRDGGIRIGISGSTLVLVLILLLLIPILVTWLKHLLDQFLPFALFVHYLNVELGYLICILHLNRHLLKLLFLP